MFQIRQVFRGSLPIGNINVAPLSTTATARIKEILKTKQDKTLTFEGKIRKFDLSKHILTSSAESKTACAVCSTNLDIKHTDVLILSQFLRSDGCMLPRRVTGLCKTQQKRIATLVAMAQKAGLMSALAPANSKKDPKLRPQHKKCNTYFDESTIRLPLEYRRKVPNLFRLM